MAARRESVPGLAPMGRDAAASRPMYRLNIGGAGVYGGLSVFLSATYELCIPIALGT